MIKLSECECLWGVYKCSYVVVLFIYGIYNWSWIDVECLWKKWNVFDIFWKFIVEMFFLIKLGYIVLF